MNDLGIVAGEVEAMIGGPPCQSFSVAGKRLVRPPNSNSAKPPSTVSPGWPYAPWPRTPRPIPLLFFPSFWPPSPTLPAPVPHCMVDATRHGLNLFVVLVDESSKARKGTSWNQIRRLLSEVDHHWVTERVTTARLASAALIHDLRDQQPATDRRLLVLSEEFAAVLHDLGRTKGRLSPLLRSAWDSGDLCALDGRRSIHATGTHISLIAHITQRELAQHLHPTEAHNGFANRCLWTAVQRSQCLPEGGNIGSHELSAVAAELRRAHDWVRNAGSMRLTRDDQARDLWHECYPALSQVRPGPRQMKNQCRGRLSSHSSLSSHISARPFISSPGVTLFGAGAASAQ
jgi:hypothetical protein